MVPWLVLVQFGHISIGVGYYKACTIRGERFWYYCENSCYLLLLDLYLLCGVSRFQTLWEVVANCAPYELALLSTLYHLALMEYIWTALLPLELLFIFTSFFWTCNFFWMRIIWQERVQVWTLKNLDSSMHRSISIYIIPIVGEGWKQWKDIHRFLIHGRATLRKILPTKVLYDSFTIFWFSDLLGGAL
jgi:hypothetical protein